MRGCIKKIKNNRTGSSDGLVGEFLKYGGMGMVYLLEKLFFCDLCLDSGERDLLKREIGGSW